MAIARYRPSGDNAKLWIAPFGGAATEYRSTRWAGGASRQWRRAAVTAASDASANSAQGKSTDPRGALARSWGFAVRLSRPKGEPELTALCRENPAVFRPAAEASAFVGEAVALLRRELGGRTPVIGFCGAPFTLAAYLVEGRGREGFGGVKSLMAREPATFVLLLEKLADQMADYLNLQIRSGAQAVQIFDSWAGILSPGDYRTYVLPALQRLVRGIRRDGVPVIYFAVAGGHLLEDSLAIGADVLGLCWRTPLGEARRRTAGRVALQGNLDPHLLFAPPEVVRERARAVLESAGDAPGHIMNLGHGILPETPLASVDAMVETVLAGAAVAA